MPTGVYERSKEQRRKLAESLWAFHYGVRSVVDEEADE